MVVLDANAAIKLVADQPHAEAFRQWFYQQDEESEARASTAPHLFSFEIGQILRNDGISATLSKKIVAHLHRLVQVVPMDVGAAFEEDDALSFYDASYLALARAQNTALVTYDATLASAARAIGIQVLSPGLTSP